MNLIYYTFNNTFNNTFQCNNLNNNLIFSIHIRKCANGLPS